MGQKYIVTSLLFKNSGNPIYKYQILFAASVNLVVLLFPNVRWCRPFQFYTVCKAPLV